MLRKFNIVLELTFVVNSNPMENALKKKMYVTKSTLTGFHLRESVEEWAPPKGKH